mmetsp:Transcript_53525/g.148426  ORF Transcript_53525/g.148426 Transcript_53525/m.148426 type:complete len:281 (+) Transcript_53525:2081-2923(+)
MLLNTSKARQISEAPARAANISGVSPSALVSSAKLTNRRFACSLSRTNSAVNRLPLSAARCSAQHPRSSRVRGSARAPSSSRTASARPSAAAAPRRVSRGSIIPRVAPFTAAGAGARALLRNAATSSAACSERSTAAASSRGGGEGGRNGGTRPPPPPPMGSAPRQTRDKAWVLARCSSTANVLVLPECTAPKSSCTNFASSTAVSDRMFAALRTSSSGSPGGVSLGGVGERGGVAPVAVRSTGGSSGDTAQGGAGPRGVRGVVPSRCSCIRGCTVPCTL